MSRLLGNAVIVAIVIVAFAVPAAAVSLHGRLSSQVNLYSDGVDDHADLYQHARFFLSGLDNAGTLTVSGYGRIGGDVQNGDDGGGRLYYLFVDKKGLLPKVDFRLGRQFFFVSAGSAIVDGGRVDYHPFGAVTITVAGGRHVLFDITGEETKSGDFAGGIQIGFDSVPEGSLDLSYFVTYDENDLARETVGATGAKRIGKYGEAFGQARLDLLSEVFTEYDLGFRSAYFEPLTLAVEYLRTVPQFDATSIYSVFAAEAFEMFSVRGQYDFTSNSTFSAEFRREMYGDGEAGGGGEIGYRYRPWDGSIGSLYAGAIYRDGAGGDLLGFELSGEYKYMAKYFLAGGIQHDAFQTDMMTDSKSATKLWIGAETKIRKNVTASARIEDTIATDYSKDIRARFALNVDF